MWLQNKSKMEFSVCWITFILALWLIGQHKVWTEKRWNNFRRSFQFDPFLNKMNQIPVPQATKLKIPSDILTCLYFSMLHILFLNWKDLLIFPPASKYESNYLVENLFTLIWDQCAFHSLFHASTPKSRWHEQQPRKAYAQWVEIFSKRSVSIFIIPPVI